MTNEEAIAYFKECNERLVSVAKDENVYDYEKQVIEADCMRRTFEANEKVIKALEQEPCEDYISRTELLAKIDEERKHLLDVGMDGAEHIIVHHARRIIEDMPSVTPQQKVGKWIKDKSGIYHCSNCNEEAYWDTDYGQQRFNYCPYCGSDNRDLESLGKSFADGYEDGLEEKA